MKLIHFPFKKHVVLTILASHFLLIINPLSGQRLFRKLNKNGKTEEFTSETDEENNEKTENSEYQELMTIPKSVLKSIGASEYKPDPYNEDGVFIAKNKKTGLWGMYQYWIEPPIKTFIPMNYDSIDFFHFNGLLTGVWKANKVGIYIANSLSNPRETIPCIYDDYKIYSINQPYPKPYLAVKKNGLWAWIDWITGELKTEFLYDLNIEKMPYPTFEQEIHFN